MIAFEDKKYSFRDIEDKIFFGNINNQDKRFIIEALRAVFFADDGLTVASGDLELLLVNDAYASMVGIESCKLIGKKTTFLVEEGILEESVAELAANSKEQETVAQNQINQKIVLNTAKPILNEDKAVYRIVSTVRDMPMLKGLYDDLLKQRTLLEGYKQKIDIHVKKDLENIIAESKKMRDIIRLVEKIAGNESTVLILGESGVGKGIIADLIHDVSNRNGNHKVSINCGAIPEQLLESELFGYSKGAFTGANREGKVGLLEAADDGTVILDEIGELPLALQPKLLTFLETGLISKVGSTETKKVNSRIIAITNRDLKKMVDEGSFREDLYYRLNVIPITVPPLRERREDIIPLVLHFINRYNSKNKSNKTISPDLLEKLQNHQWPGNIRQLRNMIERLAVLSSENRITIDDLGDMELMNGDSVLEEASWPIDLLSITKDVEDRYINKAMEKGKSIRAAAKLLGITPSMLYRKINK